MSTFTSPKSFLVSKTFWGAIVSILASVAPGALMYLENLSGISDPNALVAKVISIAGAAFAIYGRFAAAQPVTITGPIASNPVPVTTTVPTVETTFSKKA